MVDESQGRAREIFQACAGMGAREREVFLARVCAGEPELEREVRRLLAAQGTTLAAPRRRAPDVPETIGTYRVLERLGEGGMGTVYAAEQTEPVRRRVALKVIKLGMDTKEVIARFESERQALALMNHPNIAHILDAGATSRGRPFFVLEYVPGIPITKFCDRRRLTVRERLELFERVCEAIQHAHQKGVIHRDIKPSNVLVSDEDGPAVPKVIDFGIAKATRHRLSDRTFHTEVGRFLGTPEYTSPEQADLTPLDVDTRSDVYSLGVVLYELLTGRRPLDLRGADYSEVQRRIREVEPPLPSARALESGGEARAAARSTSSAALARSLRGELDWIVAKALAKSPADRYPTAQALADDVRRHLDDEQVHATPPTTTYRLKKFVRRHRIALGVVVAVASALVVGLAATWTSLRRVEVERLAAEEARAESDAVTTFLEDMLSSADPGQLGREVTVREVLGAASVEMGVRFAERPMTEARLRATVSRVHRNLGDPAGSMAQLERELELYDGVLPASDERVILAENGLAVAYGDLGRFDEARALFERLLERHVAAHGEDHVAGMIMSNLAGVYGQLGLIERAEELLRRALEIHTVTLGEAHQTTLTSLNNLAVHYTQQGRFEEAEPLQMREYEATRRRLGDDHPHTLISLQNVGLNHAQLGRWDKAEPLLERAVEGFRRVLGETHETTLVAIQNFGVLVSRHGDVDRAVELVGESARGLEAEYGREHPSTLRATRLLATLLMRTDRSEEALPLLEDVVDVAERLFDPDHVQLASYRGTLGKCLAELGRHDEARAELEAALPALERGVDAGQESLRATLLSVLDTLARIAEVRGDLEAAGGYRAREDAYRAE